MRLWCVRELMCNVKRIVKWYSDSLPGLLNTTETNNKIVEQSITSLYSQISIILDKPPPLSLIT